MTHSILIWNSCHEVLALLVLPVICVYAFPLQALVPPGQVRCFGYRAREPLLCTGHSCAPIPELAVLGPPVVSTIASFFPSLEIIHVIE